MNDEYTLDYAPSAVQHLGVGLYKQLPQALAELITNCWDADATKVNIHIDYTKRTISVSDNGNGMSHVELNENFLRVAKNRRMSESGSLSPKGRKVTGKKGLGKLALFGIANKIQVYSKKDGYKNAFEMDFKVIQNTAENKKYHPKSLVDNEITNESNGTTIIINDLTIKNIISVDKLKKSLAKRFNMYSKDNFFVTIEDNFEKKEKLDETDFEQSLTPSSLEFTFRFPEDFEPEIESNTALRELADQKITGVVFTKKTPLQSKSQGFCVLARGKLASELSKTQFSDRANDLFYDYSTGYFNIDFIDDDLKNDYISTDRQAILWESNENLLLLRDNLNKLINIVQNKWRLKRKHEKKKKQDITIKGNGKANEVFNSPNLTESDKKVIEQVTDVLENDDVKISKDEKNEVITKLVEITSTYQKDNSVYKELIPSNFKVPKTVNSKIRRLREEMISAATNNENPDRFILTQGLLLRAMLDSSVSSLITKHLQEFHELNILNNYVKTENDAYNLKLKDKLNDAIDYLDKKKKLPTAKSASVLKNEIGNQQLILKLDQLMHDSEEWPKRKDLKDGWDTLGPLFIKIFDYI